MTMPSSKHNLTASMRLPSRNCGGSQIAEFGSVLVVLFIFIVMPLIDLGIIPLRLALARGLVASAVGRASREEKASDAFHKIGGSAEFSQMFSGIVGLKMKTFEFSLLVDSVNLHRTMALTSPGQIPGDWLPNGAYSPCSYSLVLTVHADVDPLITVPVVGRKISGLNAPVLCTIQESAHWENLGRDPSTGAFFINE